MPAIREFLTKNLVYETYSSIHVCVSVALCVYICVGEGERERVKKKDQKSRDEKTKALKRFSRKQGTYREGERERQKERKKQLDIQSNHQLLPAFLTVQVYGEERLSSIQHP